MRVRLAEFMGTPTLPRLTLKHLSPNAPNMSEEKTTPSPQLDSERRLPEYRTESEWLYCSEAGRRGARIVGISKHIKVYSTPFELPIYNNNFPSSLNHPTSALIPSSLL